jgi:hypothetical protein
MDVYLIKKLRSPQIAIPFIMTRINKNIIFSLKSVTGGPIRVQLINEMLKLY